MGEAARYRTPGGSLLAVLVGVVLFVGIAEAALRFGFPHWKEYDNGRFIRPMTIPGHHPVNVGVPRFDGWFAQNNGDFRIHLRLNEQGLRNPEPVSAADGRVWFIGDSMTFGWGVDYAEMYSSVVATAAGLPTYNLASPGTDMCGYLALLTLMPRDIRPIAVVLGLVIENDVNRYDCARAAEQHIAENASENALPTLSGMKRWLTAHSALYNTVAVSLKRTPVLIDILVELGLVNRPHEYRPHNNLGEEGRLVGDTVAEVDRLRSMLVADVPFVVLIVPTRFEVRDGEPTSTARRNLLRAELDRRQIPYIDPIEQFREAGFEATHFAHDGHWSALGHRLAGNAVANWLKHSLSSK